jgi:uncharacterized repeat protein (TIGR03803 family)
MPIKVLNERPTKALLAVLVMTVPVVTGIHSPAQTYGILHTFTGNPDGATPDAGLTLSDGILYGTTFSGGRFNQGTVFALSLATSNSTVLQSFALTNGAHSSATLVLAGDTLYGTCSQGGGANSAGTIFSIRTDGSNFNTLDTFGFTGHGANPVAGLALAGNTLYGTTQIGGAHNGGVVFSEPISGNNLNVLHAFAGAPDGFSPQAALAISGNRLYGTTQSGGVFWGTVFSMDLDGGSYAVLHSFTNSPDGANPLGKPLVTGGVLYATASSGGTNGSGTVFSMSTDGSNFRVLHSFNGFSLTDGATPDAGLLLIGGKLYGTTSTGGAFGGGTVFSVGTNGSGFTIVHSFNGLTDGQTPVGDLVFFDNSLYGTASASFNGGGTVWRLVLLKIAGIEHDGSNGVTVRFVGVANNTYLVQAAASLTPPVVWQTISTNTAGPDGAWEIKDNFIASITARFYRAVEQ